MERIKKEAQGMNIFDGIYILSEKDFDIAYKKLFYGEHRNKMYAFGYYSWKSWAVKSVLDKLNEGDLLIYCDAGCTLNPKGLRKLHLWISDISKQDKDIMAFIQPQYLEKAYTKEEVFKYFSISQNDKMIRNTGQFFAGTLLVRKTLQSSDLINQWYNLSNYHKDLIDESTTCTENPDFITCRYDQSLLSLLLKQYKGLVTKNLSEIEYGCHSNIGIEDSPIWALRKKKLTFIGYLKVFPIRVINKIARVLGYRNVINYKI
ncbi:hypothetical protein [Segatella asaccharophila]